MASSRSATAMPTWSMVVKRGCGNEEGSGLISPSSYAGRHAREPPTVRFSSGPSAAPASRLPRRGRYRRGRHSQLLGGTMSGTVIVAGARTPIGRLLGGLKSLSAADLGGVAIRGALQKAGISGEQVEYVIMGQVIQAGAGQIPARQAAVKAG